MSVFRSKFAGLVVSAALPALALLGGAYVSPASAASPTIAIVKPESGVTLAQYSRCYWKVVRVWNGYGYVKKRRWVCPYGY